MRLLLLLGLLPLALALPDGPPTAACTSMSPGQRPGETGMEGHTALPQNEWPMFGNTREPPYYIQVHLPYNDNHEHEYSSNQQIKVSLIANQTYGLAFFRGVFLQVRRVGCYVNQTAEVEDDTIGSFILPPTQETLLKGISCHDNSNSAVGHRSPQFKVNETITWRAPGDMQGNLIFKAVFVQYAHIYWTDVYSPVLRDPGVSSPPKCCSSHIYPTSLLLILLTVISYINKH